MLKESTAFQLCQQVNIPSIDRFSWDDTLDKLQSQAPLLSTAIRSTVTSKGNENTLQRKNVNLKPKLGTAFACLLHARAPRKAAFIPTLFSIQFWRGGLKRDTIGQLARTGICLGTDATLRAVDKIRLDFDAAAKTCKSLIENQLQTDILNRQAEVNVEEQLELSTAMAATESNVEEETNAPSDEEETVLYSDDEKMDIENVGQKSSDDGISGSSSEEDDKIGAGDDDDDDDDHDDGGDDDDDDDDESGNQTVADIDVETALEPELSEQSMEVIADDEPSFSESEDKEIASVQPGFTLCWDNVGKKVTTRHPTATSSNVYINMALGYMAINRIPSTNMVWDDPDELIKAIRIPTDSFIPNDVDFGNLRSRMEVIVGRILSRHLSWFKDNFGIFSTPHILHEHSSETSRKSILINLGVFNENPSSTAGAIGIYERLQQYVPNINSKPYTTLVYGDGLSCERGNDAHRARANGLNEWERLEGLEPAAQEFHKEMLLLQDFYDTFFKGSSAADRGTVCQLKNLFNFRNVKSDISDNFSHAWELMCLITEGLVCLVAMKMLSMEDINSEPSTAPSVETLSDDEKSSYFRSVCRDIVKKVWHELDTKQLKIEDDTGPPLYCCGEEKDEGLIGCEERANCPNGELFHFSCVGLDPENPPEDWFCSEACQRRRSYFRYCHCHEDLGPDEPMIGCSAGSKCQGSEWYHMACVNVNPESDIEDEEWFCQDLCRLPMKGKRKMLKSGEVDACDYIYNYSRSLTWCGLNLLCRRDAVREGDGPAMMSHWKLDLVHFFTFRHPKYVILAHRLIASLKGWVSEKLRNELIWNRTVNYGGGIGRNLPMDLMNEILNRLFKDMLDAAKGRYTETTLQRCSQIVGPLGESLDVVFDSKVIENELYRHRRRAQNRDKNIVQLVSFLQPNDLFSIVCGRHHKAFPQFRYSENPKTPGKFSLKMKQLSKKLDKRRAAILNN